MSDFRIDDIEDENWILLRGNRNDRMAERVGFEPTVEFPQHTLSKRAP
jgi:hypothetical protein